jgi:hypothetical protein
MTSPEDYPTPVEGVHFPVKDIPEAILFDSGYLKYKLTGGTARSSTVGEARFKVHVERFNHDAEEEETFDGLFLGMPVPDQAVKFEPVVPMDGGRLEPLAFEVEDAELGPRVVIIRPHIRHHY